MIDLKEKHFVQALFPDIKWMADSELETWRCYLLRERVELKMTKRPAWEVNHVEAWLSVLEDEVARRKLLAKEGAPPYKGYDTIHDHSIEELRRFYVGDNFIRLFQLVTGFEVLPVHTSERWKYRCKAHGEDKNPSGVLYVNEGRYWCFACGRGNDFIGLVQEFKRMSFKEAVEWLEDQAKPREYRKKGKQWKLKVL